MHSLSTISHSASIFSDFSDDDDDDDDDDDADDDDDDDDGDDDDDELVFYIIFHIKSYQDNEGVKMEGSEPCSAIQLWDEFHLQPDLSTKPQGINANHSPIHASALFCHIIRQ